MEEHSALPGIPCQPIGYGDARVLLATLAGPEPPEGWRGGLPGLSYRWWLVGSHG